jgi:hypothetical protein
MVWRKGGVPAPQPQSIGMRNPEIKKPAFKFSWFHGFPINNQLRRGFGPSKISPTMT